MKFFLHLFPVSGLSAMFPLGFFYQYIFKKLVTLARRLHWLEHHLIQQKVAGSIPGWARAGGNRLMFLSLFPPSSPSKINKHILRSGF